MKETCGDCRHPKLRYVNGKPINLCPKKGKKVYLTQEACTDDADLKIIQPLSSQKWGMVTKINKGIHQNEERIS